jgi:hypothetical protein
MSSYLYLLYRAIKVKNPGIRQHTNPVTMFPALEIKDTIITNIEIATNSTLGLIPNFF